MDRPGHDAAAQVVYRCRDAPGIHCNNISRWNQAFAGARITAAISPVWLEKPERIAVLAMLTVMGLLVYAVIQRQVRPISAIMSGTGNKGPMFTPTTAVVFALYARDAGPLHCGQCAYAARPWVQEDHRIVCEGD